MSIIDDLHSLSTLINTCADMLEHGGTRWDTIYIERQMYKRINILLKTLHPKTTMFAIGLNNVEIILKDINEVCAWLDNGIQIRQKGEQHDTSS